MSVTPLPRSGNVRAPEAETTSVPHPLASAAAWRPEQPAIVADDATLSAAALLDAVQRAAASLAADGVGAEEVVAISLPTDSSFAIALHAVGWLGACALPLAADLPAEERSARLASGGARWAIGLTPSEVPSGVSALDLRPTHARRLDERFWPLDEARVALCTSGSTGAPRTIRLRTEQLLFSAFGSALRLGHDVHDRWLTTLPMEHVGGLAVLFRTAIYGTTAVMHRRFDAERIAAALDSGALSLASFVPARLARVLDRRAERPFPRQLRAILLGGAAPSEELLARLRRIDAPVALSFGMTEAASQIATADPGVLDGTAGAPLAFARVDSAPDGRLSVRGPLVGGSLATTDLGRVEAGRVRLLGRVDDTINCGGTKIEPARLEAVLCRHPRVAEALVVGLRDRELGEVPAALVVPRPGEAPSEDELLRHCAAILPWPMRPRRLRLVEALPASSADKPSRRAARALFSSESVVEGGPAMIYAESAVPARREEKESASQSHEARKGSEAVLSRLRRASSGGGAAELAARLEELQGWLSGDAGDIEAAVLQIERELGAETANGTVDRARLAARHLLARPGKRVRPLCVVLAASLGGRRSDATVRSLAVAAELVHAATLLHDDVIDEGNERRGAPTARRVFGNSASVLAGDHLLVRALRLVAATGLPEVLPRLLGVIDEMVGAESVQLVGRLVPSTDRELVLGVLRGKTGALFRWCMEAGGIAAGLSPGEVQRLGEAGMKGGLAFQLADDVLDLSAESSTLGKTAQNDLREGKLTWPVLIALEQQPALAEAIKAAAAEPEPGPACAALARAVRETKALDETRRYADSLVAEALAVVGAFPETAAQRALAVVLESLARRAF